MTGKRSTQRRKAEPVKDARLAIVVSRFNPVITRKLLDGAIECLRFHEVPLKESRVYVCPGAFELPQVANVLAVRGGLDAIICLGAVIRGETPHFDYVSAEAARGIQQVALTHRLPVVFGVLTTNTVRQAHDRAGGKHGNKGYDAVLTALEMVGLMRSLGRKRPHRRGLK